MKGNVEDVVIYVFLITGDEGWLKQVVRHSCWQDNLMLMQAV